MQSSARVGHKGGRSPSGRSSGKASSASEPPEERHDDDRFSFSCPRKLLRRGAAAAGGMLARGRLLLARAAAGFVSMGRPSVEARETEEMERVSDSDWCFRSRCRRFWNQTWI
jgi:hypothetical protein